MYPQSGELKHMNDKKTHECQNKMLECINEYEHLSVNGDKDSQYNDLISFENSFNQWDFNLIILEEITYGVEDRKRKYVYIKTEGIFDNIGMFARKLQKILPHKSGGLTISVLDTGEELSFHIFDDSNNAFKYPNYVARLYKLNQIRDDCHYDGYKWHITY